MISSALLALGLDQDSHLSDVRRRDDGCQVGQRTGARRPGHVLLVWIMDVRLMYVPALQGVIRGLPEGPDVYPGI